MWTQEAHYPLRSKCPLCCSVSWWVVPHSILTGGTPIQSWWGLPVPPVRKDGHPPLGRMVVPPIGKDGVPSPSRSGQTPVKTVPSPFLRNAGGKNKFAACEINDHVSLWTLVLVLKENLSQRKFFHEICSQINVACIDRSEYQKIRRKHSIELCLNVRCNSINK